MFKRLYERIDDVNRHILIQSGGTIASQVIPVAASPIFTRLYNPIEFGVFGLISFVSSLTAVFFSMRVDHGVIVADSNERALEVAKVSLVLTLTTTVLFAFVMAVASRWLPAQGDGSALVVWALLCPLGGFGVAALRTLTLWNNRVRNFKLVSMSRIHRSIWTVVASIAAGFWQYGLILGFIAGNLVGIFLLGRKFPRDSIPSIDDGRAVLRDNRKFILYSLPADVVNLTAARVPMMLFPFFFGLEPAGFLSLTYLVIAVPARFVGSAIGEVFYSYAAREYEQEQSCRRSVLKIGKLLLAISITGFGTLFLISHLLFEYAFGSQWIPASDFTRVMIPMIAVNFVTSPLSVVFYISGRQKEDFIWQIGFLATTTVACYLGYAMGAGPIGSLILLSAGGTAMYLFYFAMLYRFSKAAIHERDA